MFYIKHIKINSGRGAGCARSLWLEEAHSTTIIGSITGSRTLRTQRIRGDKRFHSSKCETQGFCLEASYPLCHFQINNNDVIDIPIRSFLSSPRSPKIEKSPWLSEHRALPFSFLLKLLSSFPALVFCYTFVCVKHSGMLCSRSKKDSRSAGGSAFTSDLSRFLKEFRQSYGMAMVSTLVSSHFFFGSLSLGLGCPSFYLLQ